LDSLEAARNTPSKKRRERQLAATNWIISRLKPQLHNILGPSFQVDAAPIVDLIFELADTDKDGVISRQEWVKYSTDPSVQVKMSALAKEVGKNTSNSVDKKALENVFTKLFDEFPRRFP